VTQLYPHVYFSISCAAVSCSKLHFVAVCCSVLQCVAVCCSVLQRASQVSACIHYGVATISRLLQIITLFCGISSLLQGSFAKETYKFKEPNNRSHPIPYRVLQYVAVRCSAVRCGAERCRALQSVAAELTGIGIHKLPYLVLQCVAVCCSVLQCVAVRCSMSQCVTVCSSVLQNVAVCCRELQCGAEALTGIGMYTLARGSRISHQT